MLHIRVDICLDLLPASPLPPVQKLDDGKGGLSLRGGSLRDGFGGFDGFGGSGEHLALLLSLSYKIQCQEMTVTVLTVLAISAVVAVPVVTVTPLKLNPPLSSS